jgi:hypothetical protein
MLFFATALSGRRVTPPSTKSFLVPLFPEQIHEKDRDEPLAGDMSF